MSKNIVVSEIANPDDPKSMIMAGQKAIIGVIRGIVMDLQKGSKAPGMTWEQIEYLLDVAEKKEPSVYSQEEEF